LPEMLLQKSRKCMQIDPLAMCNHTMILSNCVNAQCNQKTTQGKDNVPSIKSPLF